jgi:hypothetical protein
MNRRCDITSAPGEGAERHAERLRRDTTLSPDAILAIVRECYPEDAAGAAGLSSSRLPKLPSPQKGGEASSIDGVTR